MGTSVQEFCLIEFYLIEWNDSNISNKINKITILFNRILFDSKTKQKFHVLTNM